MREEIENPDQELKRLNKVIRQYEIIIRTSTREEQRHRVGKQLKDLKKQREEILTAFHVKEEEDEIVFHTDTGMEPDFFYLNTIKARSKIKNKDNLDSELFGLSCYLSFFDREFFAFLSERKLKLDFKYSLDRDNFYYKFQDIQRSSENFIQEMIHLETGNFRKGEEVEIRKRGLKRRRVLMIETNNFFNDLRKFTKDVSEDIDADGSKCLNGDDIIEFDTLEGERFLAGLTVKKALKITHDYAKEIIEFLNIPDFEIEE